jgi:hypothetical protein
MKIQFDLDRIRESKCALRKRLANAPIAEKLRLLDSLRVRVLAIRNRKTARTLVREEPPSGPGPPTSDLFLPHNSSFFLWLPFGLSLLTFPLSTFERPNFSV